MQKQSDCVTIIFPYLHNPV